MPSYYAVRKGHKTGVFETWAQCQQATNGYPKAVYKKFKTMEDATAFVSGTDVSNTTKSRAPSKSAARNSSEGEVKVVIPYEFPIKIYTDGACDPNPGASGSGVAVYEAQQLKVLKYGYHNPIGTNNTAELIALREALRIAPQYTDKNIPVEILSDSDYSLKAIFVWSAKWAKNDWKNASGEPVKNVELVKECVKLAAAVKGKVQMTHVAAHKGTQGNEIADRLAMQASIHKVTDWLDFPLTNVDEILKLARG